MDCVLLRESMPLSNSIELQYGQTSKCNKRIKINVEYSMSPFWSALETYVNYVTIFTIVIFIYMYLFLRFFVYLKPTSSALRTLFFYALLLKQNKSVKNSLKNTNQSGWGG